MLIRLLLAGLVFLGLACPVHAADDPEAQAVIEKLDRLLRSDTNQARYSMRVETPSWQRDIRMDSWDDRPNDSFFIRILSPKKDRDTSFLKVGPNLWMYIPKLERDIRIPPSMMLSSWMGSDFTNDDLVKSSSIVEDYTHRIIERTDKVLVVESLPKPEAPVVWGKLVHRIMADGMPIEAEYFDEHGKLIRRMAFEAVRNMGGRRIPTRWVMQPMNKPGKKTIMIIESIAFDIPIPAETFERANLKRKR